MSAHAAKNEIADFKSTLIFSLRTVFLFTLPSAVGLAVLAVPIVRTLFQRGEFKLVQKETSTYIRDVYDHTIQVIDSVETTASQNKIIKHFLNLSSFVFLGTKLCNSVTTKKIATDKIPLPTQ